MNQILDVVKICEVLPLVPPPLVVFQLNNNHIQFNTPIRKTIGWSM